MFLHGTPRVFLEINLKVTEFRIQMFKVVLFVFTELWTKLIGLIFYVFCEGGAGETDIDNLN